MTTITGILLVAALAALLVSLGAGIAAALARTVPAIATAEGPPPSALRAPAPSSRWSIAALAVALLLLGAVVILRAASLGHAPWSNLRDFSVAFAALLVASYLFLARSHPIAGMAPLVAALAAAILGFALGLEERTEPLVPALQQPLLLTVHVGTAALAYAISGVAFVAAVAELAQRAAADRIRALPTADVARAVGHRAVLVGFPVLTAAIVLGSVWANLAWRSYWSNDPKELAAAATWLVFGAYLHVAGRRDRWEGLGPWLIVLGFAGVLFTYIGASLFLVGEHSYAAP